MSRTTVAGGEEGQFPSKATHQQTRAYNAALVLRALYDFGPISRAEVARLSSLTPTTVGDVVAGLLREGLAREIGRGPSTGGKQPILLELVDDARHIIGLDLGESVFRAAIVDLRGRVVETIERSVIELSGAEALDVVHELVDALGGARAGRPNGNLLGIGVGTPGIVDALTGTIRQAVNLEWRELRLGELLNRRHGLPVQVSNDSRAAALAIELFSGRRSSNLVAIKVGRGIGAGVVVDGQLVHGDGSGAGEIGHVVVVDDGPECRCGRFGCLETVASARAIVRGATEAAVAAPDGRLGRALQARGELELEDVVEAVQAGDEPAGRVAAAAGRHLGRAIAGIVGLLDVERVALHGSVTALGEPWLGAVRDEVARRKPQLLAGDVSIEVIEAHEDLVLRGASALLMTAELGLALAA